MYPNLYMMRLYAYFYSFAIRLALHMGPHRISTQINGANATQKPPSITYAQPDTFTSVYSSKDHR
jgi:hypothetical protein